MRGKRHPIDDKELKRYLRTHTKIEAAKFYNIPYSTLCSRAEAIGCYVKRDHILEPTKDVVKYIKNHTLAESAENFNVSNQYIRHFVLQYEIPYKKVRRDTSYQKKCAKRRKDRQKLFIKLAKSMTYEEIAAKYGVSKVRVHQIIMGY